MELGSPTTRNGRRAPSTTPDSLRKRGRAKPRSKPLGSEGRAPARYWTPQEDLLLRAVAKAASMNFELVVLVFGVCFFGRSSKSVRAHYFRMKAQEAKSDLVDTASQIFQAAAAGDDVSDAVVALHADCARFLSHSPALRVLDDDDSGDSTEMDGDEEEDKEEDEDSFRKQREESSDSTVSVFEDGKRRRTGASASPTLPSSPLSPTSVSPGTFGGAPSPSTTFTKDFNMGDGAVVGDVKVEPLPALPTTPLSPLDTFTKVQLEAHVASLRAEAFVRRYRPVVMRLFDHHMNGGVFNEPVNPITLGLPDYFTIVDVPMDLGTVRQRLEGGRYRNLDDLSADVRLVFTNAIRYNPEGHPVHVAAGRMLDEYETTVKKLSGKAHVDAAKRAAHACNFCQGESCGLCGDKCLLFDPVAYVCDCCGERIRRSTVFYRSGAGNRWCAKCVSNGGSNCVVGGSKPPRISRQQMLQRRKSLGSFSGLTPLLGPALCETPPLAPPSNTRFVLRLNLASQFVSAQERLEPMTSPSMSPGGGSAGDPFGFVPRPPANARLEKRRNDDVVAEPWVHCDRCKQWVHQICAMFNMRKNAMLATSAPYVCPSCRLDVLEDDVDTTPVVPPAALKAQPVAPALPPVVTSTDAVSDPTDEPPAPPPAPAADEPQPAPAETDFLTAASLPCTDMSREMEDRVRRRLCGMTSILGNSTDIAASLVVREVSSVPQVLEVPPAVRALLTVPSPSPATVRSVLSAFVSALDPPCVSPIPPPSESPAPTPPSSAPDAPLLSFDDAPMVSCSPSPVEPADMVVQPPAEEDIVVDDPVAPPVAPPAQLSSAVEVAVQPTVVDAAVAPAPTPSTPVATNDAAVTSYPEAFPYRQRVLLLFQRLDGVDVCLFGLYVQEYGPEAPAPNTNRVYIAYLDSVRYLRPLQARTPIYHELLCAYLANARLRGFVGANIWACPPQRGDGYIFHVHPLAQKTPDKRRLRAWYIQLLSQSQSEGVVESVSQLADEYFAEDGSLIPSKGLPPVFAGDFWPVEAERVLRNISRLRGKGKGKGVKAMVSPLDMDTSPLSPLAGGKPPFGFERGVSLGSARARSSKNKEELMAIAAGLKLPSPYTFPPAELTRQVSVESATSADVDEAAGAGAGDGDGDGDAPALLSFSQAEMDRFDLVKLVGSKIRNLRSDFLVVQFKPLNDAQRAAAAATAQSCDATQRICCDFFDTRSGFLRMCQGNNYQFDSLRRAKHASMMILWHLHNPSIPAFAVVCNQCDEDIGGGTRYHCDTCEDFDLCSDCRFTTAHPHTLHAIPGSWTC